MKTSRLDWDIEKKALWIATHVETGYTLVARTRSELNSMINKFEL